MIKTTVIIPNWNGSHYLEVLLPILKEEPCKVIVVDNGSTDGSVGLVKTFNVGLIINKENLGFAKSNNQGAAIAKTDYLMFLNNDTEPEKGFIKQMERWLDNNKIIGAVGGKLIFSRSDVRHIVFQGKVTHLVQVAGKLQHAGIAFNNQYLPFEIGRGANPDHQDFNRAKEVSAITAACMLVRQTAFNKVKGFYEGYENGWEDNDFCLKLRENGYRLWYEPKAVVYHNHGGSEGRFRCEDQNYELFCERWIKNRKAMNIIGRDELKQEE